MMKSRPDRYGRVAVTIHWLSAVLILVLLGSGLNAAGTMDAAAKVQFLRIHVPVAIAVLLLTVLRILWWWLSDTRPQPLADAPAWQARLARVVHIALYVVILVMLASGFGMVALSGALPAILGEAGAVLPDFSDYIPRVPHGLGANLLIGLLAVHVGAALYHHFIRRDATMRRMWYGR